jgi:hypothetical protein
MDKREYLLANVRKNQRPNRELPAVPGFRRQSESLVSEFERSLKYMAGELSDVHRPISLPISGRNFPMQKPLVLPRRNT